MEGQKVTITVGKETASHPYKEFDFVTEAGTGDVSIIRHIEMSERELKLKMRRLNLFKWWPLRQIQLFMVRKALKSQN